MSRGDLLHIALMSSENRAASALGRNYPGGISAFVEAMNAKARQLGMNDTRYVDANGLSSRNVASARDLAKLAIAAYQEPLLREYSTDPEIPGRCRRPPDALPRTPITWWPARTGTSACKRRVLSMKQGAAW